MSVFIKKGNTVQYGRVLFCGKENRHTAQHCMYMWPSAVNMSRCEQRAIYVHLWYTRSYKQQCTHMIHVTHRQTDRHTTRWQHRPSSARCWWLHHSWLVKLQSSRRRNFHLAVYLQTQVVHSQCKIKVNSVTPGEEECRSSDDCRQLGLDPLHR